VGPVVRRRLMLNYGSLLLFYPRPSLKKVVLLKHLQPKR